MIAAIGYTPKDKGFQSFSFGIPIIVTFSALFWLNRDQPVLSGGGNRSTRRKQPSNLKSLAIVFHAQALIQT